MKIFLALVGTGPLDGTIISYQHSSLTCYDPSATEIAIA